MGKRKSNSKKKMKNLQQKRVSDDIVLIIPRKNELESRGGKIGAAKMLNDLFEQFFEEVREKEIVDGQALGGLRFFIKDFLENEIAAPGAENLYG